MKENGFKALIKTIVGRSAIVVFLSWPSKS